MVSNFIVAFQRKNKIFLTQFNFSVSHQSVLAEMDLEYSAIRKVVQVLSKPSF